MTARATKFSGITAQTLSELAGQLGINQTNLAKTVCIFNEYARKGVDQDFHRGESRYDMQYSDKSNKPNPQCQRDGYATVLRNTSTARSERNSGRNQDQQPFSGTRFKESCNS